MHPFTGPWRIVKSLPGASYEIEFCNKPSRRDKKHTADLSPYPPELIPFEPLDLADDRYGQLHKRIGKSPYKEAGIEGFTPPRPFQIVSHYLTKGDYRDFHFPTLAELNEEFSPFPWIDDDERIQVMSRDTIEDQPVLYTGPHLPAQFHTFRLHLHLACSSRSSLTLPTACSSFRTRWEIQLLANGGWCASHSPTALLFPHHACTMGYSSWNSIPSIMPTFGSTHPTSDIGCNITPSATLPHQPLQQQHISFDLPISRKHTPLAID